MRALLYPALAALLALLLSPLPAGLIRRVKALVQKRRGAPLLQLYRDLRKLLRKDPVVSTTSSWVLRAAPAVVFATSLVACALVPVTVRALPDGVPGDLFLFFFVLALGRFFLVLSGMDAGSSFGGMGSSREALISALVEPAAFTGILAIAAYARSTSFAAALAALNGLGGDPLLPQAGAPTGWAPSALFLLPVFLAFVLVLVAETSRIPVDDPATHLELTMVHEAMILEDSGRHLALLEYGAALKQWALLGLLASLFLPFDPFLGVAGAAGLALSVAFFAAKVLLLSLLVGVLEAATVKLRFFSVPNLAALAFVLALVGFLQYAVTGIGR